MTPVLGSALAGLLLIAVGFGVWLSIRRPFGALAVLVGGMALHNVAIMALLRLETPALVVRAVQAWKEVILAALLLVALVEVGRRWRAGWRPRPVLSDWLAVAFSVLVVGYAGLQVLAGAGEASFAQRAVSVRLSLLPPLLYFFGRWFIPRRDGQLERVAAALVGSAVMVAVFGLWELWLVPTARWIDWGAIGFAEWLGYRYEGPAGLAPNFFQSLSSGLALRRMVSTYLSPLGIAYTGLLIVPIAAVLAYAYRAKLARWLRWVGLALAAVAVLLSVTRLALVSLAGEFLLLAIMVRRWRAAAAAVVAIAAVAGTLYAYPLVGPVMTYELVEVDSPTAFLREQALRPPATDPPRSPSTGEGELIERAITAEDGSVRGHLDALRDGLAYVARHPLGTGPGSAVPRYGETRGPGESALLRIGGELGVIGAVIYLALYAAVAVAGWQAFHQSGSVGLRALATVPSVGGLALLPVMLTSDVWGNFSVTFLFWWCAGLAAGMAAGRPRIPAGDPVAGSGEDDW